MLGIVGLAVAILTLAAAFLAIAWMHWLLYCAPAGLPALLFVSWHSCGSSQENVYRSLGAEVV
jgi:hypothetical protein